MIERRGEHRSVPVGASTASIDVYKAALRAASEAGPVTLDVEEHLASVAQGLGLSHHDAHRAKREVQAELETKGRKVDP
jgi:hypothetical protein